MSENLYMVHEFVSDLDNNEGRDPYTEYEHEIESEVGDFLNELNADTYVENVPLTAKELNKQKIQKERDTKRMIMEMERQSRRDLAQSKRDAKENAKKPKKNQDDNTDTDSVNGTVLLGRDRLVLTKKINQYKTLFPKELGKFKVKKNATVTELNDALVECQTLIEVGTVDGFVLDSIMQCVKICEGFTVETDYDISGLATMLKMNPQFNSLAKLLFIKYNIFSAVPIEQQMCMIIITTSYLCIQKNKSRNSIDSYLNEPVF